MKIAVLDSCPIEAHSLYRLAQDAVDDVLVLPYARVKSLLNAMRLQRFAVTILDARVCGQPVLDGLIRSLRKIHPDMHIVVHHPAASPHSWSLSAAGADAYLDLTAGDAAQAALKNCLLRLALEPA